MQTKLKDRVVEITNLAERNTFYSLELQEKAAKITEQLEQRSMHDVNVARIIDHVNKIINGVLQGVICEPNDETTRKLVKLILECYLQTLPLKDYVVVCDETRNSPLDVDQGALNVDVCVKPEGSDSFFYLCGSLRPQSGENL